MNGKTILKIFTIGIFILSLAVFLYTLLNYKGIRLQITQEIATRSYFGIGIISFLLDGLPQMIGADFTIPTGALIGLNVLFVFLAACIGSTIASIVSYSIGFVWGKKVSLLIISEEIYEKYKELTKTKGKFAMTLCALTPIPYIPMLAGVFRMHPYDFLIYGLFMRMLRFAAVGYLSYILFV